MYHLTYFSTASTHFSEEDLENLLKVSKSNNQRNGIKGCTVNDMRLIEQAWEFSGRKGHDQEGRNQTKQGDKGPVQYTRAGTLAVRAIGTPHTFLVIEFNQAMLGLQR